MKRMLCGVVLATNLVCCAIGQEVTVVDLLPLVKTDEHVQTGNWNNGDEGLTANVPDGKAICVVPYELTGSYKLDAEFTRKSGTDVVGIVLPLVQEQVLFELSGWEGQAHGLSRINQSATLKDSNPTAVRPGSLANGKRHKISADVQIDSGRVTIQIKLNDKDLVDWTGILDQIEANIGYNIPSNTRLALAASKSVTTFHSLRVQHGPDAGQSPTMAPSSPKSVDTPTEGGQVDLTAVNLQKASGTIKTVTFQGERVLRLEGGGENSVALIPGVEISDGTIEVDIASDIFSGIAFRAADTKQYELLYFRPQNSGTAKHESTVQYASKGMQGKDWRTLRDSFPGKYEAGAKLKVNQWFRAKLVIKGETLSVFVDKGSDPVLVVDKLFSGRSTGKIGVWGWATNFRNFQFTPDAVSDQPKPNTEARRQLGPNQVEFSDMHRFKWRNPPSNDQSDFGLTHRTFFSDIHQAHIGYTLYLPKDFSPTRSRPYPVIYFLHGGTGHESEDGPVHADMARRLNRLTNQKVIEPVVMVFPNAGRFTHYENFAMDVFRSIPIL